MYDLLYAQYMRTGRPMEAEQLLKQKVAADPTKPDQSAAAGGPLLYFQAFRRYGRSASATDRREAFSRRSFAGGRLFLLSRPRIRARPHPVRGRARKANRTIKPFIRSVWSNCWRPMARIEDAEPTARDDSGGKSEGQRRHRDACRADAADRQRAADQAGDQRSAVAGDQDAGQSSCCASIWLAPFSPRARSSRPACSWKRRSRFVPISSSRGSCWRRFISPKATPARALKEADEIIALNPNDLQAHLVRSSALIGIGEREKAHEELDDHQQARARKSGCALIRSAIMAWQSKDYKQAGAGVWRSLQSESQGHPRPGRRHRDAGQRRTRWRKPSSHETGVRPGAGAPGFETGARELVRPRPALR